MMPPAHGGLVEDGRAAGPYHCSQGTAGGGDGVNPPDGDPIARLTALAGRLRGELDRERAQAVARALTERATGMLMERLSCTAAEARQQLERLAGRSGTSPAEIAAEIAGERLPGSGVTGTAPERRRASRADAAIAAVPDSAVPDAAGLAEALLAEVLTGEGAQAVAVWRLAPDGGMELAGEAGFGPREAARWRRVPPGMPFLPARSVRADSETWWPAGQPAGDDCVLIGTAGRARAVVPLRRQGSCFGALEACWPAPVSEFPASVRRLLPALADSAAQVLSAGLPAAGYSQAWVFGLLGGLLGGLHEGALFARAVRGDDGGVAALVIDWASDGYRDSAGRSAADVTGRALLETYPEAGAPGGLIDTAAQVLASGEPQYIRGLPVAASGAVMEVTVARLFDGVVIAGRDASHADRLAALLEQAQWLGQVGGWEENLVTGRMHWAAFASGLFGLPPGRPVRLAELDQRVPAEDLPAVAAFRDRLLRKHEAVTAAFRIIRADDQSVRQLRAFAQPVAGPTGEIFAVRGAYQDISAQYHTRTAFAATQEQLAGSEERAQEEHDLAVRLQQAITPQSSDPVDAAGIDVTARYRPASQEHLVGGDWYDTVLLPDKRVLLAVGDVAGHGIEAVTGMVALRNHLRGLAVTGADPATLLAWLNSAAFHLAGVIATAICGIYDPLTRTLQWARAGHLPPLIVRDGTARPSPVPSGVLLGAQDHACYQEATLKLMLGDTLVLYTDGLIERRDQSLDDVLGDLARHASRPVPDIAEFADHLLAAGLSDTGDDSCLLVISIR
jgi:serine phosphatase RsbU (regulator of sigma subunit)/PAS domain-containing protein